MRQIPFSTNVLTRNRQNPAAKIFLFLTALQSTARKISKFSYQTTTLYTVTVQ